MTPYFSRYPATGAPESLVSPRWLNLSAIGAVISLGLMLLSTTFEGRTIFPSVFLFTLLVYSFLWVAALVLGEVRSVAAKREIGSSLTEAVGPFTSGKVKTARCFAYTKKGGNWVIRHHRGCGGKCKLQSGTAPFRYQSLQSQPRSQEVHTRRFLSSAAKAVVSPPEPLRTASALESLPITRAKPTDRSWTFSSGLASKQLKSWNASGETEFRDALTRPRKPS
jgi:hypothetical protein